MASHVAPRGLPARPPDKGSFPLDHFGECSEAKAKYMGCLKDHGMHADAEECRQLSAAYLQCRMDTKLMAREKMTKLGFNDRGADAGTGTSGASSGTSSGNATPAANESAAQTQNRTGFVAGVRPPSDRKHASRYF